MITLSKDPIENSNNKTLNNISINYNNLFKFFTFNKFSGKILSYNNYYQVCSDDNYLCKKFNISCVGKITRSSLKDYLIEYNYKTNRYNFIEKQKKIIFNIDKKLTRLDFHYIKSLKNHNVKYDIRFLQFLDKNILSIETNINLLKNYLKVNNNSAFNKIKIYFSNKHDLDILYDSIEINLQDLINNKKYYIDISSIRYKTNPLDITICSNKIFENYTAYIIDSYYEIKKASNKTFNRQSTISNLSDKETDIILKYDTKNKLITLDITENFYNIEILPKILKFYLLDVNLDFLEETIKVNTNNLLKNRSLKIKINSNFNKTKMLHTYENLRIKYENTNHRI